MSSGSAIALPSTFVDPKLKVVHTTGSKSSKGFKKSKSITFNRFLKDTGNAAVFGDIGSGKSTFLRKILTATIAYNTEQLRDYPIPVFLSFRQIDLTAAKPLDLAKEDVIQTAMLSELNSINGPTAHTDIEDKLEAGCFTVLIDGLDELDDQQSYHTAMGVVQGFAMRYKKCRIIITSRLELMNQNSLFRGFKRYRLEEFTARQIRQLATGLFGRNTAESKKLVRLIERPAAHYTIPHTPLALTIVAILFQNGRRDLPSNLTELMQKYIELALGRWDKTKNIESQIEWTYKEQVLKKLSWMMLNEHRLAVAQYELEQFVANYNHEYAAPFVSSLLINELTDRSGLFLKNADGLIEFKHRSFQDYFAGLELNSQRDPASHVVEKFGSPLWSRAVFFACGLQPENEAYLEGVVAKKPSDDLDPLHFAFQLGFIAQAAVHVRRDIKLRAVVRTLHAFVLAWNSLARDFHSLDTDDQSSLQIPYPIVALIYCSLVRSSLGSTTLVSVMDDIACQVLDDYGTHKNRSDAAQVRYELSMVSLAVACAASGAGESFARIFESDSIRNPVYALIALFEIDQLRETETLDQDLNRRLTNLSKKIKRKLSNNDRFIRDAFQSPPMLLEENESDASLDAESILSFA